MIVEWEETTDLGPTLPNGFRSAGVRCGLKTEGNDLALIVADRLSAAAGVYTTNQVRASCVDWSRAVTSAGWARAIVCNAGNANACNGASGAQDTETMASIAAEELGIDVRQALVASTGVIGHRLPVDKLRIGIPAAVTALGAGPESDMAAARAIITTDLRPKMLGIRYRSDASPEGVSIGGICKGSGMIAPNMATMLCFLTTDADIAPRDLQHALATAVAQTFNRMTVDGDTSTNDMTLILASGVDANPLRPDRAPYTDFVEALTRVCRYLAREVARDGEGATKLVDVHVRGANTEAEAETVARTIAQSPLVKTALFGSDPNWGRILAAAGRAGVPMDPSRVRVLLGDLPVCEVGSSIPFDRDAAHAYLKGSEVTITVDLGSGSAEAVVWTCDFSYDYVRINAEYHT